MFILTAYVSALTYGLFLLLIFYMLFHMVLVAYFGRVLLTHVFAQHVFTEKRYRSQRDSHPRQPLSLTRPVGDGNGSQPLIIV